MTPSQSYSSKNLFKFDCPANGRLATYSECLNWHAKSMVGKKIAPPACLACMASSKCPARYMQDEEYSQEKAIYYSAEGKKGSLSKQILDRIRPVIVLKHYLELYGVGKDEMKGAAASVPSIEPEIKKPKPKRKPAKEFIGGNMGDVISKAVKKVRKSEETQPALSLLERARLMKSA